MDRVSLSESRENFQKIRTKSCGDVPRRLFLPFSSRFQVSSSFRFHVFLIMQTFLNVCYFTFLTPFRFTAKKSSTSGVYYVVQTNPVQQVLSTLLIITGILYSFLDLRFWLERNLKERPDLAFRYASYLLRGFIPLMWGVTFWLKRKWFSKLLKVCQGKQSYPNLLMCPSTGDTDMKSAIPNWKLKWIINLLVALSFAKVFYEVYQWDSWDKMFTFNIQLGLYNLRQYEWEEAGKVAVQQWTNSTFYYVLGYTNVAFFVVDMLIEHMFDLFCLIGGAMVYAVCGHFADEMEKLSRSGGVEEGRGSFVQSKTVLKQMQKSYVDLIAILDSINEVFGSLIVLYFMRSYPTLVWCVFGLFRKVTMSYGVFYLHKISIFVLVTLTAAEGNSKVQQFKQWLFQTSIVSSTGQNENEEEDYFADVPVVIASKKEFETSTAEVITSASNIDMVSVNILHREVSTETLGLKGYKFFTVTHGLIGTMLGIVVTYAIVMLQFEMDAEESQRSSSSVSSYPNNNKFPTTSVPYMFLPKNINSTLTNNNITGISVDIRDI